MNRNIAAALLALVIAAPAAAAELAPCGAAGAPCQARDAAGAALGVYLARAPETDSSAPPNGRPAIFFIHGWRSSAEAVMRVDGLRTFADEVGAVLIAPQGLAQTWSYPGSPSQRRDEFAYFEALRRDAIARHGVDPDRILVSGFSMGGSMAWYLACFAGDRYWAFAPFAGAFWHPMPERCESPTERLRHVHGTADRMVPLEGRALGGGFRQRGAGESLNRLASGLELGRGRDLVDAFGMRCAAWAGADDGAATAPDKGRLLELCLHEGGHIWRPAWLRTAWERFTTR
ncbi:MAG: PHB depolymerase family esterase [Pseudomonadota bacterium]